MLGLGSCGILVSTARADLDKFKSIAYQAKNISDANTMEIVELKESFKTYRAEYREDQRDTQRTLQEIVRAVKK